MWKESVAHAVSLGQGRTRTGLEDWARVAGSDRRRRSRTVLKDGARADGAIADDVDEDGALEDGVLAADNAPADRGIGVLSWRGLGRVDGARERKGRGDGEGMTGCFLVRTMQTRGRTRGRRTKVIAARRKCPSSSLFSCIGDTVTRKAKIFYNLEWKLILCDTVAQYHRVTHDGFSTRQHDHPCRVVSPSAESAFCCF